MTREQWVAAVVLAVCGFVLVVVELALPSVEIGLVAGAILGSVGANVAIRHFGW